MTLDARDLDGRPFAWAQPPFIANVTALPPLECATSSRAATSLPHAGAVSPQRFHVPPTTCDAAYLTADTSACTSPPSPGFVTVNGVSAVDFHSGDA